MASRHTFVIFLSVLGALLPALAIPFKVPTAAPYDPSSLNLVGSIQSMTLNANPAPGVDAALRGGTITVNGIVIIVPDNTIATLPAAAVAWTELFDTTATPPKAQLPGSQPWEATIFANRVAKKDPATGNDIVQHIAGLVYIAQSSATLLTGFITSINSQTGHFTVAGAFQPAGGIDCVINDPLGIHGPKYTVNPLWGIDPVNPSITNPNGFPMCIPRVALPLIDPFCPMKNRPTDGNGVPVQSFTFKDPKSTTFDPVNDPDPFTMAPLLVGDYITFTGQQIGTTFEINSLEANVGIFTAPGALPAYLKVEAVQVAITSPATGPFAIGETKAVAFTTDPSQTLGWYAQDVDPCTGAVTERLINILAAENAAPPLGRAVFRLGKVPMSPATRNVIFRLTSGQQETNTVNKFSAGQYVQPVFNFNFPELTTPGFPMVANAFEVMPFLAQGSGPFIPGNPLSSQAASPPIIGQLVPWPGTPNPNTVTCPNPPVNPPANPPATPPTTPPTTPPATTTPDTITIITATQTKLRQGTFQIDVTAKSSSTTAKLSLTIAGSNPVPNPLTNAPMTSLGNGQWSLSAQIKGVGISCFVTSDLKGQSKTFTF